MGRCASASPHQAARGGARKRIIEGRLSPHDSMNAQQLLTEISDYCRQTGLAESTFGRRAVQRRQARGAAAQRRPHHHRHARPHPRLHGRQSSAGRAAGDHRAHPCAARAAAGAVARGATPGRRSAAQFPLLRQPAKISLVRQYLQREVGGRATASPRSWPISIRTRRRADLRCRGRRRLGADPGDARRPRPLQPHAVLCRRQRRSRSKTCA